MKKIALLIGIMFLASCNEEVSKTNYIEGEAFGTTYHIQFFTGDKREIQKGVDSVVAVVNHSVSTYIFESDISKINRGDSTVVIDDIFREAYDISKEVHEKSEGYFDPTIGVLRNAYGFGDTAPLKNIDKKVLDSLMQYVGFHKVKINDDGTVFKKHPQIYFDFNAVAKGTGIDNIGRYMESQGITDYLIELGGEILTKGKNIDKDKDWVVGIEIPESDIDDRTYKSAVKLKNVGMAASGNYRKFRIDSASGKKYVHTLNPLTGSAEMSDVTSATVIATTCGEADAYATAFMAMGLQKSKDLLNDLPKIEAFLTYTDSLNHQADFITKGFRKMMLEQ